MYEDLAEIVCYFLFEKGLWKWVVAISIVLAIAYFVYRGMQSEFTEQ